MPTKNITIEQRIWVAKDRAIDELSDLVLSNRGYFNLNNEDKLIVHRISSFLSMPDDDQKTLDHAKEIGYINGEEELFFDRYSG